MAKKSVEVAKRAFVINLRLEKKESTKERGW